MNQEIAETLAKITANVRDVAHKPLLRPVLEAELMKMRYDPEEVAVALNKLYEVTLQ